MRGWLVASVVTSAVACIQPNSVTCPSGRVCPEGATCIVAAGSEVCAADDQLAACAGVLDGMACTFSGGEGGCFDGVCLPASCGNLRVDPNEVCDDANDVIGDGCAFNCLSNETCGNGFTDLGEECDDGGLIAHDGCSNACGNEFPIWIPIVGGAPDSRFATAMAYDATRDRIVMYGGSKTGASWEELDDTWEWNGDGWSKLAVASSAGTRWGHAMAYDDTARVIVLFGGQRGAPGGLAVKGPQLADTWTWDGIEWTAVIQPAPAPIKRRDHQIVNDSARHRLVMFGGHLRQTFNFYMRDTWEWIDGAWQKICDPCDPPGRAEFAMAYDPSRGVTVMFGGRASSTTRFADTWEYDGTWREITPVGTIPAARRGAAMSYDPVQRKIVMSGGFDSNDAPLTDTWLWDGQQWTDTSVVNTALAAHATHSDPLRGTVISFGGETPAITRSWNGAAWSELSTTAPPPVQDVRGVYDLARGRTVMFGGNAAGVPLDQTWELVGGTWTRGPSGAPARSLHAMAYDQVRRNVVMFGGDASLETWTYDGTSWLSHATPGPSARISHAMAFDGERVILFGGRALGGGAISGETWSWDGATWTQLSPATSPPALYEHAMAYDPVLDRIVLFGGDTGVAAFNAETWTWDGFTWMRLTTVQQPPPRSSGALAWDPSRRRMVLFGGANGISQFSDTWELDTDGWKRLALFAMPPRRSGHMFASQSHGVAVFGGFGEVAATQLGDAWRLRWESVARDDVCVLGSDIDEDGLEGCADGDCWGVCTPLCPPGVMASCAQTTPHCGDGTCSAVEGCRSCAVDCGACNVCGDGFCDAGETIATCPGDCTP